MNKERSVKETFLRIIACVVVFGFGGVCPQRGSNEPNNKLHNIHAHFYEGGCVNAIIHQCIHDFAHLLGMCVCVYTASHHPWYSTSVDSAAKRVTYNTWYLANSGCCRTKLKQKMKAVLMIFTDEPETNKCVYISHGIYNYQTFSTAGDIIQKQRYPARAFVKTDIDQVFSGV